MASYDLEPVSLRGPTDTRPQLTVTFRRPSRAPEAGSGRRAADPIWPATGLQVSLCCPHGSEFFAERMPAREIEAVNPGEEEDDDAPGLYSLTVPQRIPAFSEGRQEIAVRLYAWREEKLLGSWDVGTYTG